MVGDLGRTELASSAEQGARALFETTRKLKTLPDHIEILPVCSLVATYTQPHGSFTIIY